MRVIIGIFILVFIFSNYSKSQQSIGFTEPSDIQSILDYRLPDWRYSIFLLDLNVNNRGVSRKNGEVSDFDNTSNFSFAPSYNLFKESEDHIIGFSTNFRLNYRDDFDDSEAQFANLKRRDKFLRTDLSTDFEVKKYLNAESFFYGDGLFRLIYNRRKNESRQDGTLQNESVMYDRILNLNPRLGFGFGRIRNVGPIIRALRLQERLKTLNYTDFSDNDVQLAADQFTRYQGYLQNYDRPEKYFWKDLNQQVSSDLGRLDVFDTIYLTDVFDEAIGLRLEGWEIIGGVQFSYFDILDKRENRINNSVIRSTDYSVQAGPFLRARWFKNISLRQQWGAFINGSMDYFMESKENEDRDLIITGGLSWLWTITDRILLQSILSETYSRERFKSAVQIIEDIEKFSVWENRIALNTVINVFVENSLQLNFSATPILIHQGSTDNNNVLDLRSF